MIEVERSPTTMPSTTMRPWSMRSSMLMQRSSVLLPEPLGPMITRHSPGVTVRLTSSRTLLVPNDLWTPSMDRIGAPRMPTASDVARLAPGMAPPLAPSPAALI